MTNDIFCDTISIYSEFVIPTNLKETFDLLLTLIAFRSVINVVVV